MEIQRELMLKQKEGQQPPKAYFHCEQTSTKHKVPQAHSQKEEPGSVSLLKVWFPTISKRKQNSEIWGTSALERLAIQTQKP